MADAKQIVQSLVRIGEDPRVFGLTMTEREHALAASVRLPMLLEAARAAVAMTLKEAIAAHDAGRPKLYCACDHLNPCWSLGDPITTPLHHWGDAETGPACEECTLRAAITKATGSAS